MTADYSQDSDWRRPCWIYIIEDGPEYRREAVSLTELNTIDNFLEGFDTTDMEPKRKEWILNASEVLVPATTLNRRAIARFDPDSCPEFKKFTSKWRAEHDKYQ